MFPKDDNIKENFKQELIASLKQREEEACSTWDLEATLALPWGVKLDVDPEYADAVAEYIEDLQGKEIMIDLNNKVKILRIGMKERRGKYALVFRYQLNA